MRRPEEFIASMQELDTATIPAAVKAAQREVHARLLRKALNQQKAAGAANKARGRPRQSARPRLGPAPDLALFAIACVTGGPS